MLYDPSSSLLFSPLLFILPLDEIYQCTYLEIPYQEGGGGNKKKHNKC